MICGDRSVKIRIRNLNALDSHALINKLIWARQSEYATIIIMF